MIDNVNLGKCKVMHVGTKSPSFQNRLMGSELAESDKEKDLGVIKV